MIRIAICDDEPKWINTARNIINNLFGEKSTEVAIETFDKATPLLATAQDEPFDILILDIDMPDVNGFGAAEKLKELYPNMLLMFYSAHEKYVFDSFKFQPFRYIRKEKAEQELKTALIAAAQVIESRVDKLIYFKCQDGIRVTKMSDIMYFNVNKRKCDIHLNDGSVIDVRKTIKELFSEMVEGCFVWISNSAAVNIGYIDIYSPHDITLRNGTKMAVSRTRIKNVKAAITQYWRKKMQ